MELPRVPKAKVRWVVHDRPCASLCHRIEQEPSDDSIGVVLINVVKLPAAIDLQDEPTEQSVSATAATLTR